MNIMAVYGSPSKNGNSASLTDAILKGAVENGHTVNRFYLYDLNIGNCLACNESLEIHTSKYCIQNDEMTNKIIPALIETDIIIISSPVYMGHISGATKNFLDRWHTFILKDFAIRFLPGKKFITIVTSAAPTETFLNVSEYFDYWLTHFFKMEKIEQIHAGDLMESGAVLNRDELLTRAYEIGKNIN